jgi:hypothetical protein
MKSKWNVYDDQIEKLIQTTSLGGVAIAQKLLKTKQSQRKNPLIKALGDYVDRLKKTCENENTGIHAACENVGVNVEHAPMLWLKTKTESVRVTNPLFVPKDVVAVSQLREQLIADLQQYSPKFPKIKRIKDSDSYLLVIDPADVHIGKLCSAFEVGEDYNNQIAVQRVLEGVKGILQKVSSFKIDQILFIGGNDILHIDNPGRTTTSGTNQDTDGMWHSNFLIAKQLYIDVLEILITVADVHFDFNPSNHDYTNGFFLAQVVETYFRNCKNITFNCSISHRKAFEYHSSLVGTSHGDGAKMDLLPLLMAQEYPMEWSRTRHRYVYVHHLHHKWSKDMVGVTIEGLRSLSGTDSWHHRKGFEHAPKAIEAFLHSKEHGQIARITHIF